MFRATFFVCGLLICCTSQAYIEMSKTETLDFLQKFSEPKAVRIYESLAQVYVEAVDGSEKKEIKMRYNESFLETVETICNSSALSSAPAITSDKSREVICWSKVKL